MSYKNFKTVSGIDIDSYTFPVSIVQKTVKTNSATTVDTLDSALFLAIDAMVHITQGSKRRTSSIVMQTNGSSVDLTEYGIIETGGAISGVAITASMSGTDVLLKCTITDAASTPARVRIIKNNNPVYSPEVPNSPTIGTVTVSQTTASVPFTAPSFDGGSSITGYTAISSPGSITRTSSSSPISIENLVDGTSYTFTVRATNAIGSSEPSSESNSITASAAVYFGYISGGYNNAGTLTKWSMTSDTSSTTSASLTTTNLDYQAGHANTPVAGYVQGGEGTTFGNKIAFPTDTITSIQAMATARTGTRSGAANSGTAGYVFGGSTSNTINKLTYSNDTNANAAGTLAANSVYGCAHSNNGTAAYSVRGANPNNANNGGEKFPYSTDTRSALVNYLTSNYGSTAFANSGIAGYVALGYNGSSYLNTLNKLPYSTDTASLLGATLSSARTFSAGFARSGTAGYIAQGVGNSGQVGTVDKLAFSNETMSTPAATVRAHQANASFANSGTL